MTPINKWENVKLGPYCSKIGSGITPKGGESVYISDGVSLIRSQNVYNAEFSNDGLAYITNEQAEKMNGVEVKKDDVLLNITGDSVARCCSVPDSVLPARVNQHVSIIRPDSQEINPRFLMYYLISPYMQAYLLSIAGSGGTRKALTKTMIEGFDIPHPLIDEQKRIADTISVYDELIENNRRRIKLLEQSARLLYKEWFVHLRFPGHEHVKIIDGVPEGWEKKPLVEIGKLNYGKSLTADNRIPGPFPVYGSSGVIGNNEKSLVKGPGIIIGRKGNVGSVFWSDTDYFPIDTVYYIDSNSSSLHLYYALLHTQFISTDVAVPGLNRDFAHTRPVLLPKIELLDLFNESVTSIHNQISHLQKYNETLVKARELLLPRLMNGEIAV